MCVYTDTILTSLIRSSLVRHLSKKSIFIYNVLHYCIPPPRII